MRVNILMSAILLAILSAAACTGNESQQSRNETMTVNQTENSKPVYLIADEVIQDAAKFEEYRRLSAPSIAAFSGEPLVRGGEIDVLEGNWQPKRLVVIRFANLQRAKDWYSSPEYSRVKHLRQEAAQTNMILVEGEAETAKVSGNNNEQANPAYLMADIDVHDPAKYDEYAKAAAPSDKQYGGVHLIRAGRVEILEGSWQPKRFVMLKFDSLQRAKDWYASP